MSQDIVWMTALSKRRKMYFGCVIGQIFASVSALEQPGPFTTKVWNFRRMMALGTFRSRTLWD